MDRRRYPWLLTSVVVVAACLGVVGAVGCGSQRESLSDCREDETGYVIRDLTGGVDCEEASAILGLLGSAEHGVQPIQERGGGVWKCRAFPSKADAPKFRCRQGPKGFVVVNSH